MARWRDAGVRMKMNDKGTSADEGRGGKGLEGNNVPKRVFFGGEKVDTKKACNEHGKRGKRI
jgi:hypothetical protein